MKTLRKHRQLLGWFMTCLMTLWLPGPVQAETWTQTAAGPFTWTTAANWSPASVPNAIDAVALLQTNVTANQTINLATGVASNITLGTLSIGDLLGTQTMTIAPGVAGSGLIFDVSTGSANLNHFNGNTDVIQTGITLNDSLNANIYAGTISLNGASNAQVALSGAGNLVKNGSGRLQINPNSASYTGNWILNLGTIDLGAGSNNTAPTALGTGTGGIVINGSGSAALTVMSLQSNGSGANGTATWAGNNDLIVNGSGTIDVRRNFVGGANDGVTHILDNLTMNGGVLVTQSANSHRLRFDGTTTLVGDTSVFSVAANATAGFANLTLQGVITDGANSRALIKEGAGRMIISNSANTYNGVTAVKDGVLQVASGANLGSGATVVNGGAIGLSSAGQATMTTNSTFAGGLNLVSQMGTTRASLGAVVNTGFLIDGSNPLAVNVPVYGMALEVDSITNAINLSNVGGVAGNTRVYLSNTLGFDSTYTGAVSANTNGVIRLASAANNLILSTTNQLGGAAATSALTFGVDWATPTLFAGGAAITHGTGGTVSVRANNANTLGAVTVHRGVTVNINGTGLTTPLGAGVVTVLGGTITTDNATNAAFGNTDFRLFGGSTLTLDNRAVVGASTDRRLINTTSLALTSSTLNYASDGGAAGISAQTVGSLTYRGGSFINIGRDGATAGSRADLTVTGGLTRANGGTLVLGQLDAQAATLGTASATSRILLTAAPTVTNGMIGANIALLGGANMQSTDLPLFTTYNATNGLEAAAFGVTATNLTGINSSTASTILDINGITGTNTLTANVNAQAVRLRTTANTQILANGGFTVNIGTTAAAGQGAGLYLAHTTNDTVAHTANFAFGTQEGVIYTATPGGGNGVVSLTGTISGSNGVTRFGPGILSLAPAAATGNTFTGSLTINSGETRISQGGAGAAVAAGGTISPAAANSIDLWGGSAYLSTANARYNNNVTFNNDARFGNVNVASTGFNNLTVNARTGSTAPVVLDIRNQAGNNVTTGYGTVTLNAPTQAYVTHVFQTNGAITGTGTLEKYGNERWYLGGNSSGYSAAVTVNTGVLASINANSAAKPFGTGAITINPGAAIRLAAATNINAGQVTLNSDLGGISGIALSYVGDPAALPALTSNTSAPNWRAYLGISAVGFNQNIDQSTLWGGNVYLGATVGDTGVYTGTLTPATGNKFLLGTGQGTIRIAAPLTGASNSAIIGLSMTGDVGRADQAVNNSGGSVQYDVPMTYGGDTIVHINTNLRFSANNAASGIGAITLNGGNLRPEPNIGEIRMNAPLTLTNTINLTADSVVGFSNNASTFRLGGVVNLANGSSGVARQLFVTSDNIGGEVFNAGILYFDGGIADGTGGASGNHFIKAGPGLAMLTGTQTYTGTTTVTGGFLGINGDADLASSSQIILAGGGLAVLENSFTTGRNMTLSSNSALDVMGGLTLTQASTSTFDGAGGIIKRGLGTLVLNGNNAQTNLIVADGILSVTALANIGDPAATAAIQIGGDFNVGGASNITRYTGGTFRVDGTFTTNRGLTFNNNGNTTFSGGIDVTAGNTLTLGGVIGQGTEFDTGMKTGAGTLITTAANTARQLAFIGGTYQFGTSTPWTNSTATAADNTNIDFLGGTVRAVNTTANIALANAASTTNYNYGGGGHLRLESGAGFSVEFAGDNLIRNNQGTLVIETAGGTTLGAAGGTNAARLITTNVINSGVAAASAVNNGIFAPHLITADSAGVANFTTNSANGVAPYTGAFNTTLSGLAPTAIASISSVQNLTGTNSIYAFRTTADVSGGTLSIKALDNVNMGGILINGSNTISSNLVFDITSATAAGTGTLGEGLIYVKTGENAAVTGNVTANALTKFGAGTLTLSSGASILSDLSIQEGVLKLGTGGLASRLNTDLNVNAGATLDLNGNRFGFETIGSNNRQVGGTGFINVGGTITNSGSQAILSMDGPGTSTYTGLITGALALEKNGTGVLNIDGYRASTPDAGRNTFTGPTNLYGLNQTGGINLDNATFGLGGANGSTAGDVNLYSGTLGLLFSNGNTGMNTQLAQQFNNQVVKFGAEAGLGYTINVKGPAQINVNQSTVSTNTAFGQANIMQVGALNMSNNTLNLTGGNLYRVRVAGTTTIQGAQASFQTNSDGPSGALELVGQVTGSGALNKLGDGSMRGIVLSNASNNYSGGTNIIGGDIQVTSLSNALGSGPVRVFPDGTLRIAGNGSVTGANLQVMSRVNALGAVSLDDNFIPTVLTSSNFSSAYGTTLQLSQAYFTQALDLSTIADGRTFLGSGLSAEVKYMAPTLGAGVADAWNPSVGVYRLVGGVNNLAFDGTNNVLTGSNYLQIGPQRNNVLGAVTNSGNTVIIRNSNNFTAGTQVAAGSGLTVETGGSPVGERPLGTGAVEVYGTLNFSGQGSNWKADASAATNTINLRPGGLVRLIDGNISAQGGNLVAGDQGRWGDTVGIDLNGGQFRFDGGPNVNAVETIGDVTVRKGGVLTVARNTAASSAQLNVGNIDRIDRGTLTINYNAGFLGTNLTTPLSFERLTATQIDGTAIASALGGTTSNGATVVNGGMIAPWIVDQVANTFVGYNPTGTGTGFQPIVSSLTPGAGEIAYNQILSGATIGALGANDIVDVTTAAKTLAANTSMYALRLNQNISPTASFNTLTIGSGGILNTGTPTINPTGSITPGVVSPMTINFGSGGAGEAIFFNAGNMTVQAQMVAAQGLTKFGGSQLIVNSINPGIDGAVTINAGTVIARVPFSGTGTPLGAGNGVFGGQDIILNAGILQLDPFLANASGSASVNPIDVRASATFDSNIFVRGNAGLNNNGQATLVRISNLTFENAGGAAAMDGNGTIALALQSGVWVGGTTTLIPQSSFNMTANSGTQSTFAGQITQIGTSDLEKFGNGTMTLLNGTNNYSGGTTIWGTTNNAAASTVASGFRGTGTPFGSGAVTVNPGGMLRIADNANIASNAVTLKSDGVGLAGLGIAHNGALPTIITTGSPAAGQVKVETTGPFGAVLGLDYGYYSQAINLATIGNGDWWLGNSTQAEAFYFNNTLGANSNGKYQIGAGGAQNGVSFGSVLVSGGRTPLFENLFTGGTANTTRVEVGALTADLFANGPSFVNGNGTNMVMVTRNTGLVGDTRVNTNTTLAIGNNFALGNGRLILNGGNLRADFGPNNIVTSNVTIDNNVLLQGDFSTNNAGELVFNGNVDMDGGGAAGGTRTWNLGSTGAMAVGLTAGSTTKGVISGLDGSNLIKVGAQQVSFRAANTYQGFTQIGQSTIVAVGDVLPGVAGPLGNSTSAIILAASGTNVGGGLSVGGKYTVGRDILVSQVNGTGVSLLEGRTNEIARITGGVSILTGTTLQVGAAAVDVVNWRGGTIDLQGQISGAGILQVGTTAAAPANGGTVLLSASSNGFGTNTYSGGTQLLSGRLQIASDTYFTGLATAPTILSGPLGTGTFTFLGGESNRGGTIEAVGGPRVIVNALGADNVAANTTRSFSGREALTFTRNYDIQADPTVRNRTFTTNNFYQPITFSGNLSNSSAQGANFVKLGAGMLVLTGTNTQANLVSTDAANYGVGTFIDAGILRVNSDAALGSTTALAAAGPHTIAGPADVRLRGGVLSIASGFTTTRQMQLTAASGIDVASGQTLTLSTATSGAFGLTKTGPGTLALNSNANTITNLTLGGAQQINPNVGLYSATGGTVSTTATTGTPFATTAVTINSGTLSLADAAAQALTIPTITYGAAGQIATNGADVLTATTLTRGNTFNSVSYGTLILQPSSLAALGTAANEQVTTGTAQTVANGTLATPSVFARLSGSNQAATFVTFGAPFTGFGAVTYSGNTLNGGAFTTSDLIDVGVAGDTLNTGATGIYALRTAGNIAVGTQATLNIGNGGLIMNPGTANAPATINPALVFGTGTAANLLTEAIAYVADTNGASVIAGGITARDFTKTGPGLLEISGSTNALNASNVIATPSARLPVVSVQDGTLRFASTGAQFTNQFRPAGLNTTLGSYVLNVNEAGIFDINGLATTLGGLTGNGTVTSNAAGAVNLRIANGFGVDPTFTGAITNGSGTVAVTKTGNGILTLSGHGSYTGGTTVEAGRVTNAVGSTAANGRLEAQKLTSLGTGSITLQGGTLTLNATTYLNGAQTASEVTDGFEYNLWGGGNGYDLTVSATAFAQGVALPANVTSTLNAATQNAGIGTLTVNAPIITSTAGIIQVNGATTFNQDTVIRTAGGRVFLAGRVNAAGYTLTKTGANDLVLTHTESGLGQNSVGAWKVYGGTLTPRVAAGASNPLGSNQTVEINTGATGTGLFLTTDGDGTAAAERVMTFSDTSIRFGSTLGVSSSEFVSSGLGRLQTDRILGNNDDKQVVLNNLTFGGVLGSPYMLTTGGNGASHWFEGTTTFTRDMYLQNDIRLTLNGLISGNGTFVRRGTSDLFINADNTTGYKGGTVLGNSGTTYFGSMDGNRVNLSSTAKLGGQVIINPNARLLINGTGNVQSNQTFSVGGNLNNFGVFGIGSDTSLDSLGYRALGTGGIQSATSNYYTTAVNPNGSVLALNTVYTQTLNQRALGDGMGYIGSTTNGVGAHGLYDAATLAAGRGDTFRLGAGGATLFVGLSNANVLTNVNASRLTNLIVGAPMSVENNGVIGNGSGTVVLLNSNNYGGTTWINRGSTLDFRGTLATSAIETYGVLNVAGEAGTFIGAGAVTLRPGSTLRFDNTSAGVLPVASTAGRWADATAVNLNNATVRMQGNAAVETSETVGTIASTGGSFIELARGVQGRTTTLVAADITRGTTGFGTVQINHTTAQLGTDEMLKSTAAPTVTNGMIAPWMVSNTDVQFLTYNGNTGITLAGFDSLANGGTTAATVSTPANRVLFQTAATVLGTGFDIDTYAARLDQNLTLQVATTSTVGANRLIVQSGGLILNGTRTVTTGIQAGAAGTSELLLFNNGTVTLGDNAAANRATSGQIAASSITKFGAGQLNLNSEQQAFTGNIRVQQGSLVLRYANGTETDPVSRVAGNGGTIFMDGPNTTLFLRGGQDSLTGNVTFSNSVTLGDFNPIVQIDVDRQGGAITNRRNILNGSFTFGANNAETGQIVRFVGTNAMDLQIGDAATDNLTLAGRSVFQVTTSTSDIFVAAKATGAGQLVVSGIAGGLIDLANVTNLNDYSGGTNVLGGFLVVRSKATNVAANANSNLTAGSLGTGGVTIVGGTLSLLVDSDVGGAADANDEFVRMSSTGVGLNLNIAGSSTINVDRNLAAGSNKILTFNDLSIGSQILTTTGANAYALGIAGTTTMTGNMFLNTASADVIFTGSLNDGGAGLFINKVGPSTLYINSTNSGATAPNGGVFLNGGLLDFGNRAAGSTTATIGTGDIYVNAGAQIRIRGTGNLNTGAGQQVVLTGTPYSPSVLRTVASYTQANLSSFIQSRIGATTSNEVTYVGFEAALAASNLDQSTLGDGRIYFGAVGADRTYTGAATGSALTPGLSNIANSVLGGTSTNRVYRLGGGDTTARALFINLTAAGAGLGDVGGATDVQIGSLANLGPQNLTPVGSAVVFQDQNTYTGQTVVSRFSSLRFDSVSTATAGPLGGLSGGTSAARIDVYGTLQVEANGTFRNAGGTANAYTNINLRPGSSLVLLDNNATTNSNRWDDSTSVSLDGARLTLDAANNVDLSAETVGSVIFDRGARIQTVNQGTSEILLTAASVTRAAASTGAGSGRGTLVFTPAASANLGLPSATNNAEQVRFTTAPTASATSAVAGMLPGYYIDGTGNRFVTHNATTGIVPVGDGSMVAFTPAMTAGTAVVNVTGATTLPDFNPSIYALRIGAFALSSPTGANNDATITFGGSGSDVGGVLSTGASTIHPNLRFGSTGTNEALFYAAGNITLNGNITAGSVTKFGASQLIIGNDQSDAARGTGNGYKNGWFINEGALTLNTFGSAGNAHADNVIVLNGNQASTPTLFLRAQPADTLLNYTYTSGRIYVVDNGVIDFDPGADDRVHTIADIEIQQSGGIGNAVANGTNDAQLRIVNNRNRSILAAGQLTITNNAIVNVDSTLTPQTFIGAGNNNGAYLTNGVSNGMSVASLAGSSRLTKWGDGYLYIRGDSSGFSGPVVIDEGAIGVAHVNALGSGAVTINRYGVLDILVAGFTKTATYNEGSVERWSVDGARTGTIDLGKGTLQVGADQNQTVAVTLNGGSIEGWLRTDDTTNTQTDVGVFRNLGADVSVTLASNSFVGNQYYLGANGLDSGRQTNDLRPTNENIGTGATLNIQGVISGSGSLTKVGFDTVILSGANTYTGGTVVSGGTLKLGAANALPTAGSVSTYASGVFDLNGYNQTVGVLTNPANVSTNVSTTNNGYITNSGASVKTLTAGNATNATYRGVIQNNVALEKAGASTLTLTNANTYIGNTTISAGTLALDVNGSINDSPWINIAGGAAVLDLSAKTSYTYDGRISGGGSDVAGTSFATATNAARIRGNLVVGDHIGEVPLVGAISPGANTITGDISTAGNQIGQIYTNGNLTINGPLAGTVSTAVDRLALQITTATVNAMTLGAFDYTSTWLTANAASYLTSTTGFGSLAGHDYINVGGTLSLNQYGRVAVTNLGAGVYAPGDVFNLLDWTSLSSGGFTVNGVQYDGSGDAGFDLDLPTLSSGLLWDTSLFLSHGVVFVVPEPSRALFLMLGLLGLMMRRRRKAI